MPRPSGFRPGDSVAVIGVGALGQAHAIKAQLMGAGRVFAIDPSQKRLDVAARVAGAEAADADELRNIDLVVNATGFPGSFAKAIKMVRDGGTIIEVGAFVNMGDETFNPAVICGRNLTLLGIGGEDLKVYDRTLALMARHADSIPFAEMVSHRFDVADAPAAMETALDAERSAKVLITQAERVLGRGAHDRRVGVDAGPVPDPDHALVDEHPEAVEHRAAARLGVADQARPRRVADHVGDDHARAERLGVERHARVDVGEEADRGGVDDDVGALRHGDSPLPRHEGGSGRRRRGGGAERGEQRRQRPRRAPARG